jgi:hypothetical protein
MSATAPSAKSERLIEKGEKIRIREHRLTQNLRLTSAANIVDFVHSKGLVSVLGGNELPSVISAVLGKSWKPSSKGFTGWLDWWSFKIDGDRLAQVVAQIERRDDILASRIFRRSKTFVSNRLWPIIGPIVDHHETMLKKEKQLSPLELKILDNIRSERSIRTDRLRKVLELEGKANSYRFHRSLSSLESHGLIVGAEDPNPDTHLHANIWQTWNQRTRSGKKGTRVSYPAMVAKLLERTIDSCIFVPEDAIRDMFEWRADTETAKDQLLREGTIVRAGKFLVHSRIGDRVLTPDLESY